MKIVFNSSPVKIIKKLSILFIILSILNLMVQISKYVFHYREQWMFIFNMDREVNFPTLYTVMLLAICAFILKQIMKLENTYQKSLVRYWKTLHYIFIYLAFDEALQIHELFIIPSLGKKLPGIFHFVWVIPYGLITIFFINYFLKFIFKLPKETNRFFSLSGTLYIGAALGLEMVEGVWVRIAGGMQNFVYSLLASAEEMIEIIAILIFIYALLTYIIKFYKNSLEIEFNIK